MGLLKQAGRSCGQVTVSGKMLWHWSRIPFAFLLVVLLGISTLAEAQSYRFSRVEVQGNQRIQSGTIANYIGIPSGTNVSAGALNDAYQRVVESGLFESVEIIPQGSTLVVRVVEYPTINRINFEGNRRIKDELGVTLRWPTYRDGLRGLMKSS